VSVALDVAQRMLDAVEAEARARDLRIAACVVDGSGDPVAFRRMDGVGRLSAELCQRKAFTSAMFKMPSGDLGALVQPGAALYGLDQAYGIRFLPLAGGVPLLRDGVLDGAIAVSGSNSATDAELALVGAALLGS
jgi:uncharacterized protein GlcG (DUF336 family)